MTSLLILNRCIFCFREVFPILTKISGYLHKPGATFLVWQTSYSILQSIVEWIPCTTTRLSFHGTDFPCGTSLLIWKQFIFMFQIGPANFYQNIGISSQVWNYGLCLTNFIQLSSIYCTVNPLHHHKAIISWYSLFPCGIVFYHALWITHGNGYSQQL